MSAAIKTIDHEIIRRWTEERGGNPASVSPSGAPRIEFPGEAREENLRRISWEQFFSKFESDSLALLYQESTEDGKPSTFHAFASREQEMD